MFILQCDRCERRKEYTDGLDKHARIFLAGNHDFREVPRYAQAPGCAQDICQECFVELNGIIHESDVNAEARRLEASLTFLAESPEPIDGAKCQRVPTGILGQPAANKGD